MLSHTHTHTHTHTIKRVLIHDICQKASGAHVLFGICTLQFGRQPTPSEAGVPTGHRRVARPKDGAVPDQVSTGKYQYSPSGRPKCIFQNHMEIPGVSWEHSEVRLQRKFGGGDGTAVDVENALILVATDKYYVAIKKRRPTGLNAYAQ